MKQAIRDAQIMQRFAGWGIIVACCLVVVGRWAVILPLDERFSTSYAAISSVGKLLGLTGFMLYAINFVLSTRLRFLEPLFGGLNRVFIAHHITGGLALIFLLFHPLLLALRYVQLHSLASLHDAAVTLLPRSLGLHMDAVLLRNNLAIDLGMVAFLGMVGLLLLTFYARLPYQVWLFTHKFLGLAFLLAGLHIILITSDVSADMFLKLYLYGWFIIALAAFAYRTLLGRFFIRRATYTVQSAGVIAERVIAVILLPETKPIDFTAGQFVFIRFKGVKQYGISEEAHPFSIASAPAQPEMVLCIRALGDFTNQVAKIPPGTVAEIEGAYGMFTYRRFGKRPQIWIAGGIGITPFLSMARSYSDDAPPVTLIYSVVKRAELIDQAAVAEYVPKYYQNFTYHAYIKDEQEGFLTAEKVQAIAGGVEGKEIFICGPPPMMAALRSQLQAMGVPKHRIHTEEFRIQ